MVVAHDGDKYYGAAIRPCFTYAKANNADTMVILELHELRAL